VKTVQRLRLRQRSFNGRMPATVAWVVKPDSPAGSPCSSIRRGDGLRLLALAVTAGGYWLVLQWALKVWINGGERAGCGMCSSVLRPPSQTRARSTGSEPANV
jgi:hypothetical protein